MFLLLVFTSIIYLTNALNPLPIVELGDNAVRDVIAKYIENVPDIEEQYIIDERLSRVISQYFKGKISSFPLYKVSVKIDRNPVRIPWTLDKAPNEADEQDTQNKTSNKAKQSKQIKHYRYRKNVNENLESIAGKAVEDGHVTTTFSPPSVTINTAL